MAVLEMIRPLGLATFLLLGACSSPEAYHPNDLDEQSDNAGISFEPSHIMANAAFFDVEAMSQSQVQDFLENTPYGYASGLASYEVTPGRLASAAITEAAMAAGVNPLVILTKLQKEAGIISKESATGLGAALGCACPDGGGCSSSSSGFQSQLDCFVDIVLRDTELLATTGETYAGWGPRIPRRTLDPVTVVPANEATAILYTYTPWVLPGRGGNWLMWNVWNRYAEHIGYRAGLEFPYNEGFIGASCDSVSDCQYADALCESGVCTLPCTAGCPDAQGHYAPTFCIDTSSGGRCLAQCTSSSPCDEGASCVTDQHRPDLSGQADVCVPNAW